MPLTNPSRDLSSRRWLYLPDGWDDAWIAAKAASSSTPAGLALIGASYSAGYGTDDVMTKSLLPRLRALFVARGYPTAANYYPSAMSQLYATARSSSFPGTPPFVVAEEATIGERDIVEFGLQSAVRYKSANPITATMLTFTSPSVCTGLDILYADILEGTWKYKVDGGTEVTVNGAGSGAIKHIAITGLASAAHVFTVTYENSDSKCFINGITTVHATTGIRYAWLAVPGESVYMYARTDQLPADKITLWQGYVDASHLTSLGFPTQNALTIIELGVNDCALAVAGATHEDGLRRFCQAIRRGYTNASILFILSCNPDAVNSDVTSGNLTHSDVWTTYMDATYRIAQTFGCAVANIHHRWGETPYTQGFTPANDTHPTDAGIQDITSLLAGII